MPRALRHLGVTLGIWIGCRLLIAASPEFSAGTSVDRSGRGDQFANLSKGAPSFLIRMVRPDEPNFISGLRRVEWNNPELSGNRMSNVPIIDPVPVSVLVSVPERTSPVLSMKLLEGPSVLSNSQPSVPGPIHIPAGIDHWSLSAFAIYRPNSGPASLSPTSQLGGSQFGFRLQRSLVQPSPNLTLSFNLRGSTPLKISSGKEAGIGLAIRRAGRIPIELIAERRVAFDGGGRNAFAGLIATGFNDLPTVEGFNLNGYAQAGIVGLQRRDGFVDGSLRLDRKIASKGSFAVELGGGVWGAVQPHVSRVDIGPSAAIRFRIGKAGVRLGSEWRQRVSGNAHPGSGPAITFGLDY